MKAILSLLGRAFLLLAAMAFLTATSLFVIGGFLVTWPILRQSPREARIQSVMTLALAVMGAARAFGADKLGQDVPKSAQDRPLEGAGVDQ